MLPIEGFFKDFYTSLFLMVFALLLIIITVIFNIFLSQNGLVKCLKKVIEISERSAMFEPL